MRPNPFLFTFLGARFVFRNGTPNTANAAGTPDAGANQDGSRTARAWASETLSAEAKALVQRVLQDDQFHAEKNHLVDQLTAGSIDIDRFRTRINEIENEEETWDDIFDSQRATRKRITLAENRAASLKELLPSESSRSKELQRQLTAVNFEDYSVDRDLKQVLQQIADHAPPLMTDAEVKALYLLNPTEKGFDKQFAKLTQSLKGTPEGEAFAKQLMGLKRREATTERQFEKLMRELERFIDRALGKLRKEALKEDMLMRAQNMVGIKMKAGTVINYRQYYAGSLDGEFTKTKIKKISFDEYEVRDGSGKVLGSYPVSPIIYLDGIGKMPIGKFKKWVERTDAAEQINDIGTLEERILYNRYGVKLKTGDKLEYQRFRRASSEQDYERVPHTVGIEKIGGGRVTLSEPVYIGGISPESNEEYKTSLSYGEFARWYHMQEVQQSLSLQETRKKLGTHNKLANKEFRRRQEKNPPILLEECEILQYSDGSNTEFKIDSVSDRFVKLDNGKQYTLPQFFHWVQENDIIKKPEIGKTPDEIAKEQEENAKLNLEAKEVEIKSAAAKAASEAFEAAKEKNAQDKPSDTVVHRLKALWDATIFMSYKDFWNMLTSIWEFMKRKHERRSKYRYSSVGTKLPWVIGTEFERISQSAENEEVQQYKDAMGNWGVWQVKDKLYSTGSRDEAKACFIVLSDKGELRLDDPKIWMTLNRMTSRYIGDEKLFIPPPDKMPPGKSGEQMTQPAIDAMWGQGQWAEWFSKNINTYNGNKKAFEYKGKQLEADPTETGGLRGELKLLLQRWRDGEYVNPQHYEELIDFAIKYGKLSISDKMFFIIMGVVAESPKGYGTLLHLDRPGDLDGQYLNQFPLLDFFTDSARCGNMRKDKKAGAPLRLEDYKWWADTYFKHDAKAGAPGAEFNHFLWNIVMFDQNFRTRLSKGLRNAENMDHDDAFVFVPPSSFEEIKVLTGSPGGGEKKYFTPEGYCNAYPGFNQYFIALANADKGFVKDELREGALKDTLKSFIMYDGIISNRLEKEAGDRKARLSDHHFDRGSVVDQGIKTKVHRDQLRNLMMEIGRAYGQDISRIFTFTTGSIKIRAELEKQKEFEGEVELFLQTDIERWFQEDGGRKAIEVINRAKERDPEASNGLRGMRSIFGRDIGKDGKIKPEAMRFAKEKGLL